MLEALARLLRRLKRRKPLKSAPLAPQYPSGIYEAEDELPADLVRIGPWDSSKPWHGKAVFDCRCEVSFRDGWYRLHAIEPSPNIIAFDGDNLEIEFLHDALIFDHEGNELVQIVCAMDKHLQWGGD